MAKKETALALSQANNEANALKTKALSEISAEKEKLEEELKGKILSVAIKLNEKLFADSSKNIELLATYSKKL